jgi:alkanesulfonate monooxygenase SsuD/methylene tetrahydromethanopterin reductase-like flavin-dependent oxidoreductase (luciferase family)
MQIESRHIHYGAWLQNGSILSVKEVVEFAVEAENAGWEGVFVSNELSGYSDPWTVLAAIAVQTERIRIGTWITPIPNNLPSR